MQGVQGEMVCEYSGRSDGPANFDYESDKYSGTPETSGIISDQGWWTQHSAKWTLVVPKWTLKAPKWTQLDPKAIRWALKETMWTQMMRQANPRSTRRDPESVVVDPN